MSCRIARESYYSYKIDTYITDTAKHFFSSSSLISYGDYLFEYKITIRFNTEIHGDDKPIESVVYDTTGIYLLSGKSKQYCEFDTFALESKIIGKGPFSAKPTGVGVSPVQTTTGDSSNSYYDIPQATSINHIQCYYSNVVFKDDAIRDSLEQDAILVKKENFNSLYKIRGIKFTDTAYCIVGFRLTHLSKAETFIEQINHLRHLTDKEIQICRFMVKASGL